jgi:1-acyl-sn-glycerol-3-phosphate acyltransferase
MQNIVIEKPYRFIPPYRGHWWPSFIHFCRLSDWYLRRNEGVVAYEIREQARLQQSLEAGHGILLTPNHCRNGDPLALGWLARSLGCHLFAMASWHLFNQSRFMAFAIRRMGAFSIYREGVDRQAINMAIQILETAERPLIIFPEGAVSRTNDRLNALLDGVAFIARTAAKRRAKQAAGKVVIHPVALKYRFLGDLRAACDATLSDIEHRFSWQPQRQSSLFDRIRKLGRALLCLKEIEYFGCEQPGTVAERQQGLINRLLHPLEKEWHGDTKCGPVVPRVKALRMKILPDMVEGRLDAAERQRRWGQLADIYLAQQVASYPPDYLVSRPTVDRFLEFIQRFEEDLTDRVHVYGALKVIIEVGEAIEVHPQRDRHAEEDPLMAEIERRLQGMLDRLAQESPLYDDGEAAAASPPAK